VPLFRYEALDQTGNKISAYMQETDEQALTARLTSMGYRDLSIEIAQRQLRQAAQFTSPVVQHQPAGSRHAAEVSKLSTNERALARMFHQLHLSFRAGMPAFQAVSTVAVQVHEPPLRQALAELSQGIQSGDRLSALMERYPRMFSRGDVGMIRAAEEGGFLPEAMEALAVQHEQDDNTRRRLKIWEWFFHSNVVVFFIVIPLCFFFKTAIESGFNAMAGLAAVGRAFLIISVPSLAVYFAALIYLGQVRRSPGMAVRWHRFLLRVPVVGRINALRANAVFTRTLQQLYHAGVNSSSAWDTASGAVPNRALAERFGEGLPVVESTGRFSQAMQQVGLLDLADVGMVATGESTGEVAQALDYLAGRYEEDTRVALGASVIRGAITFSLWAFGLGAIALALFFQSYYGVIFGAVEKAFGIGE
jgi:type II secretory pathway component PulF